MIRVFIEGLRLTARWVARWLKITSSEATGAVIIGCNPLGRLIARLFQDQGESVVLIDTDPEACQKAEEENLPVFQSSGLNSDALEEAGIKSMGTFMALTSNPELNLALAQQAMEEFQPPRVLAVTTTNQSQVSQAFIAEVPIKTWNHYLSDGQVKLGKTVFKEPGLSFQQAHLQAFIRSGELLPLLVKRDRQLQVVRAAEEWQAEDEIIYLLHDPRPKLLKH